MVSGVVKEVRRDAHQLVVAHEDILGFMEAMTMPFNIKDVALLSKAAAGERITFQLHVTGDDSWIDHIERPGIGQTQGTSLEASAGNSSHPDANTNDLATTGRANNPLRNYKFTNELGQAVSLSDFRGQAVALTFFFTRCPVPQFCPRLSRNFQEAQRTLESMGNAPTNWHLLSVTFDPAHDTPEVLKAYGAAYQYDAAHWSFLTGPKDKIAALARLCDVQFDPEGGLFNHNFRTLIINSSNQLQMVFPTSGNISESIVQELLKAVVPPGTNSLAIASPTK